MLTQNFKRFCLMKQITKVHKKTNAKHCLGDNFSKSVNTVSHKGKGKKSFERYASYLDKYGNFHPNPLSLQQLVNFGKFILLPGSLMLNNV